MKQNHSFFAIAIIAICIISMAEWYGHRLQMPEKPAGIAVNCPKSQKDVVLLSQQTMHGWYDKYDYPF